MSLRTMAVVGARPNMMKIAPILHELQRRGAPAILVHTGQHYDERMSEAFFRQLEIPAPDHYLGVGSGTQATQTAQVMVALEPLMEQMRPDVVLVVGDVNSTAAAAIVAAKLCIPIAHVEAGLRSFDRTMPEEINRLLTDAVSDYLLVSEPSGIENLRREGVPEERIHFVGNVMIDTLLRHRDAARALGMPARLGLEPGRYALVTLHRPANVDSSEKLAALLDALGEVQRHVPIVFPVHPRTRKRMEDGGLVNGTVEGMRLLEPLGYLEFLGLMAEARLVMTDSGGIQEETTILGVPCLTLRDNTERPATITDGTNTLVGTSPDAAVAAALRTLESPAVSDRRPALWDGRAAERIVEVLLSRATRTESR